MPLRHLADREILGLALPALGALAAEPLYLLVDTAMVGHLGTPQFVGVWAGLAALIAGRAVTCGLRFSSGRWAITGARA